MARRIPGKASTRGSRLVILLRGINVGGRNRLTMGDLRGVLAAIGCTGIRTYVQSGNAVVDSRHTPADLATTLKRELGRTTGIEAAVLTFPASDLAGIMAANPYAAASAQPNTVHVYFLEDPPAEDACRKLDNLRDGRESFVLSGQVLYLHAPDGIGRSRLVKGMERALGTAATGRNWRTMEALAGLADTEA